MIGHHPAEMEATIKRFAALFRRRWCGFSTASLYTHQDVFEDFTRVLSQVDVLLLTEVYPQVKILLLRCKSWHAIRVQGSEFYVEKWMIYRQPYSMLSKMAMSFW